LVRLLGWLLLLLSQALQCLLVRPQHLVASCVLLQAVLPGRRLRVLLQQL
jgi:hypothetical protein